MRQWITNIKYKIIQLRRTIGHLKTIISCKKTGIFTNHQKKLKDDSLSVLLFILSVNPLSFLLLKPQGCACGKHKNYNVTHNFFVDDLKLYASSINTAKKELDLVTAFSKDTGMTFGDDKSAYRQIKNGKTSSMHKESQHKSVIPFFHRCYW